MIDWPLITNRLRSSHGNLEKVARSVGSCPVHLQRLARGEVKDTKFYVGLRLLDMHSDDYPDDHERLCL